MKRSYETCYYSAIGSYMSYNTVIHRTIRPVVPMVTRIGLNSNQITTMRLSTGLSACIVFGMGTYGWMDLGGIVFVFLMLLDRADGELARHTGQMSLAGHRYDLAADGFTSVAAFVGLGIGLAHTGRFGTFLFGAFAGLGIGALFFELNVLKVVSASGRDLLGGRLTVDPDDAMIFVPILIWCHLAIPMVVVAAVIAPCAAVVVGTLGLLRGRSDASGPRRNWLGKASS